MSSENHQYEPSTTTQLVQWLAKHWHQVIVYIALGWLGYMQTLDAENRSLRQQVADLQVQVRVLQFQRDADFGSTPEATIVDFLDALPRPAWCKYYDPDDRVFRMLHVNPRYEFEYGITNERYRDQTDADVHPRADADAYMRNDMAVYENRGTVITSEPIRAGDRATLREFWKFFLRTRSDRDLVCGIQVSE